MYLKSFRCASLGWSLDHLSLGMSNLIVGKNASGKTRSLDSLMTVRAILAKAIDIKEIEDFDTDLTLIRGDDEIKISIAISDNTVVKESFTINDIEIIKRDSNSAIFNGEVATPPANELMIHVRRDVELYPDFEDVIIWADKTVIRSFIETTPPSSEQLYEIVSKFSGEMKKHVVKMANQVGFPITMFDTLENVVGKSTKANKTSLDKLKIILFKEKGVPSLLSIHEMSNGMQRTLLLFIFIECLINAKIPAMVAIDDLGEGLDYDRATKVGKLLFETCRESNTQLIATSNEEFMMNIVDIDKWNILVRDGQNVRSITRNTHPEIFEEFRYSGLDNFDFFTSDIFRQVENDKVHDKK